ncbi:MAG: alpha-galactosidase [Verrucomicrobiota bacterium]|nr:alpha-galactosidase [Verrucomicrobiota bacterium]
MKPFPNVCYAIFLSAEVLTGRADQAGVAPTDPPIIQIATAHSALTLRAGDDGRLYELGYGRAEKNSSTTDRPPRESEFYPQYGDGFVWEPALQAAHVDGNTSTDLRYVREDSRTLGTNVTLTRIELKDSHYPFYVTLCLERFRNEDVIEQWVEIRHQEHGVVVLRHFASSAPVFNAREYWLTQFYGDWAREATMEEEKLGPGIKILDSKLGVRASRFRFPSFALSENGPAREDSGEVIGGSLAWSGSYQLAFDMDSDNHLRALCGINPSGEAVHLEPGRIFKTPAMLWTWSAHGAGRMTRNFDRWARRYGIRDGDQPRPVLLNNWEATGFNFDEKAIVSLFDGAQAIGADVFLLDDGWFGNAHPRNDDHAGLGDWQVNTNKLPRGLSYLAAQAGRRGVKFGIWIEPEMVNPRSDLFEKHPDWAIQQPHRPLELSRNQLDLDLSNPAVQQFVRRVVDEVFGTPGVSFVKWDCNRYVTQPGSTYLPPGRQSDLLIDYNLALYNIMARMAKKYPRTMAMLCSGGGGRADYGALKYFDEMWPSDNTDPLHRVFIQWGYSYFFPAEAVCDHITRSGNRPLKFAEDVAMSGALGVDMDLRKLPPAELEQLASAVALYKKEIRDVVEQGDLYRLRSPYEHPCAALDYVSADRSRAVLFVYQVKDGDDGSVRPRGLDPQARYRVREVNLPAGANSQLAGDGRVMDGVTLMRDGLRPPCHKPCDSAVIELVKGGAMALPSDESTRPSFR